MFRAELKIQKIDVDAKKMKYYYTLKNFSEAIVDKSQLFSKIIDKITGKNLTNIINDILINIDWNVFDFIQEKRLNQQSLSWFIILTINKNSCSSNNL